MFFRKSPSQVVTAAIVKLSLQEQKWLGQWLLTHPESAICTEIRSPLDQQMSELQRQVKVLRESLLGELNEKQSIKSEKGELEAEQLRLHSEIKSLKSPLMKNAAFAALTKSEIHFKSQNAELLQEKENLTQQVEDLENEIDGLEEKVEELEFQIQDLQDEMARPEPSHAVTDKSTPSLFSILNEDVVVTKNSRKFHKATCPYLHDVAPHFKTVLSKSEAVAGGGRACRTCSP